MPKAAAETISPAIPIISAPITSARASAGGAVFPVLLALSFCHMLNDMMQALLPSVYPILKTNYGLSFVQVGLLTLAFQASSSVLQPVVGQYTDRHPLPYSLPVGMGCLLAGMLLLAGADNYVELVLAAAAIGVGSSIFHPESSRVARLASGGRYGMAQSLFQVGGNFGQAIAPLLAAMVVLTRGQGSVAWFALTALLGMLVLAKVGQWYKGRINPAAPPRMGGTAARILANAEAALSTSRVRWTVALLVVLIFSKFIYMTSFQNYLTFYLIQRFHLSVHAAQLHLFMFLTAVAVGTLIGGPIGDKIGRNYVIWLSILGVLPFTLALPYAGLHMTEVLIVIIGLVLASAFPAIVVYAQELLPGRVGLISGLFFGVAFGLAGIGAAVMGLVADATSIVYVYQLCSYLPVLGLFAAFLPNMQKHHP